jgi:hypothetical protein
MSTEAYNRSFDEIIYGNYSLDDAEKINAALENTTTFEGPVSKLRGNKYSSETSEYLADCIMKAQDEKVSEPAVASSATVAPFKLGDTVRCLLENYLGEIGRITGIKDALYCVKWQNKELADLWLRADELELHVKVGDTVRIRNDDAIGTIIETTPACCRVQWKNGDKRRWVIAEDLEFAEWFKVGDTVRSLVDHLTWWQTQVGDIGHIVETAEGRYHVQWKEGKNWMSAHEIELSETTKTETKPSVRQVLQAREDDLRDRTIAKAQAYLEDPSNWKRVTYENLGDFGSVSSIGHMIEGDYFCGLHDDTTYTLTADQVKELVASVDASKCVRGDPELEEDDILYFIIRLN